MQLLTMTEDMAVPKRVFLTKEDVLSGGLSRDEIYRRWQDQDSYIDWLQSSKTVIGSEQNEEQLRKQQQEAARRENVLVMRLTAKEQEMQDCLNQIEELKRAQNPSTAHLRDILLDPAINLMFQRMKKEMDVCKDKLEQAQNDLAAWKFTADGQTGKRLMAKCRMLLQENDELGVNISSGRTAKLEGEVALEKKFVEEMKCSQAETDEFLVEMDEDVEGMQSTIYLLQQQLKDSKQTISDLRNDLVKLRSERHHQGASGDDSMDTSAFQQHNDVTALTPQLQYGKTAHTEAAAALGTDGQTDGNFRTKQPSRHHQQQQQQQSCSIRDVDDTPTTTTTGADSMDYQADDSNSEHYTHHSSTNNGYSTTTTTSVTAASQRRHRHHSPSTHDDDDDSTSDGGAPDYRQSYQPPLSKYSRTEAESTPTRDDTGESTLKGSGSDDLVQNGLTAVVAANDVSQYDSSQDEM